MINIQFVEEKGFEKEVVADKKRIERNIIRIERYTVGVGNDKVGTIQLQALTTEKNPKLLECKLVGMGDAALDKLYDEYESLIKKYTNHGFDVRAGSIMEGGNRT